MTNRRYLIILAMVVALPLLAACGKKSPPVPPPGEKNEYPRQYPAS